VDLQICPKQVVMDTPPAIFESCSVPEACISVDDPRKQEEFETVDGIILCTVCHDSFHNKRGISSIGYQVHVLVISYLAPVDQSRLKII